MRRLVLPAMALLLAAAGSFAQQGTQAPRGGAGFLQPELLSGTGFSVERIVTMVGYFLPPAPDAAAGSGAAAGGARNGAAGAGGAAAQPGANAGGFRAFRIPVVDAKYYLTAAQLDGLLPLMKELSQNPYPSPSVARRIQAGVDQTLTRDQKREWDAFVKNIQDQLKSFQSQTATAAQGQRRAAAGESITEEQRQALAQRRAQAGGAADGANAAGRQLTPEEIRQRMIDALVRRMTTARESL